MAPVVPTTTIAPAARLLEERDGRLDPGDGAHDVDLQAAPPGIVVHALRQRADIGDEDIETAERRRSLDHPGAQRLGVGNIRDTAPALHPFAGESRHRFAHRRLVAGADRHVAALVRQQFGDGAADAARAAGDDRVLALEVEVHTPAPFA